MRTCHECGFRNIEGVLICEDCGFPLIGTSLVTAEIVSASDVDEDVHTPSADLAPEAVIELVFEGFPVPVQLMPDMQRIVLGRLDSTSPNRPDIDLTPYGAFEKGVSRTHAELARSEYALTLIDLDSANGTAVNGRRLASNQAQIVRDGDHLVFGQLNASVHFRSLSNRTLP